MWLAAGSGSEALGLKKFVFVVLMLLVGAGWAGFHAPELLPQAQMRLLLKTLTTVQETLSLKNCLKKLH